MIWFFLGVLVFPAFLLALNVLVAIYSRHSKSNGERL